MSDPRNDAGAASVVRHYPSRPVIGVGAVAFTGERQIVLVRRAEPPLAGTWSLPGGVVELGEYLAAGVAREVVEETGLTVDVGPLVDVFEHVSADGQDRVEYHFVVLDYLCLVRRGEPKAGGDAAEVVLADPLDLTAFALTPKARDVIDRAYRLAFGRGTSDR